MNDDTSYFDGDNGQTTRANRVAPVFFSYHEPCEQVAAQREVKVRYYAAFPEEMSEDERVIHIQLQKPEPDETDD